MSRAARALALAKARVRVRQLGEAARYSQPPRGIAAYLWTYAVAVALGESA